MTLKSDAKLEEKLTLGSKNDMRDSVNFNASSSKSGNLHFDVLFSLKSTEELSLITLKKDPNFEQKLTALEIHLGSLQLPRVLPRQTVF